MKAQKVQKNELISFGAFCAFFWLKAATDLGLEVQQT